MIDPAIWARPVARLRFGIVPRRRFYRGMASLMRAGRSPAEALEMAWRITTLDGTRSSGPLAAVLRDVRAAMRNGLDFAQAMQPWVSRDEHMRLSAHAGGDGFPATLEALSRDVEKRGRIRRTIGNALAYPILLIAMAYGLTGYFSNAIAPAMGELLPRTEWVGAARLFDITGQAAADGLWWMIGGVVVAPILLFAGLPRWAGRSRMMADGLPILALYARLSALTFLASLAALLAGGVVASDAVRRLRVTASPYLARRLDRLHRQMLDGAGFGSAFSRATPRWPDRDLGLAVALIAETPDVAGELARLADDWLETTLESLERQLAWCRAGAFLLVFAVVSGMILAMHGVQGQITAAF